MIGKNKIGCGDNGFYILQISIKDQLRCSDLLKKTHDNSMVREGDGNGNGNANFISPLVIVDIHGRTGTIIHENTNKSTFKNLNQLHSKNSVSIIVFHVLFVLLYFFIGIIYIVSLLCILGIHKSQ